MFCRKPILLLEDDPVDAMAIKRALRESNVVDAVTHVSNAGDALSDLRSSEANKPSLILLDLNLPGTGGIEFLRTIKRDPFLKGIPVIVLTASEEPCDIFDGFDLGIAGYMVKPASYEGLVETVKTIQNYWSLNQLPADQRAYCH